MYIQVICISEIIVAILNVPALWSCMDPSASVHYCQCQLKNKAEWAGLGTRLCLTTWIYV